MLTAVLAGVTFGLSVALPFGPMSLVCVQRSITDGPRRGLVTGLGAASAQGIFATGALLGQGLVSTELIRWSGPIRLFSATLLVWLGIRTLMRHNRPAGQVARSNGLATYGSALALALSNPMTVLPYIALASGAAVAGSTGLLFSSWSVPGVMTGALAWYAVLSTISAVFRPGVLRGLLRPLNLVAGLILIAFGIRIGLG